MTERDPRYDILFEPVPIGPVVARNRFFQVPHCNGMGYRDPTSEAFMRGVKAEGGWAVVCTEEVEIHPTADITPAVELRLWDDADIPSVARIAEKIHEHGALAGIELVHGGMHAANLMTRLAPMGPSAGPMLGSYDPVQARAMTLADIADFREWHRAAVRRSLQAGYDLVYVYAGHGYTGLQHFLSPVLNQRTDAYGGSIANRMRLLRELLEDARELCDGTAAVACRLGVVEPGVGISRAETEEVVGALAELPDLWDFQAGAWEDDSASARFSSEAFQEQHVVGLKALTTKPVVGVGRFTSPDTMVDQVRRGVLDLIGAARPSIADPFLPEKIRTGRLEAIRECIGCNLCVSGDYTASPIRCTQNPSMGEEWRRGWHPERLRPRASDVRVAVVGAGPAGLEAATSLGRRGYAVTLLEAGRELGGRVRLEAALPGLATWIRVADHRTHLLGEQPHVEVYRQSEASAEDLLGGGFAHVVVATGSRWRTDGVGRTSWAPLPVAAGSHVLTPDDLLAGRRPPTGARVLLYDDDHFYLGGVLAELLSREGCAVELVTPAAQVSEWAANTMEQGKIRRRLASAGVAVTPDRSLVEVRPGRALTRHLVTGDDQEHPADAVVLVTSRLPVDDLHRELEDRRGGWDAAGLLGVHLAGDCLAPGTIAAAVWSGRSVAERLEADGLRSESQFLREVARLAPLD